MKSSRGAFRSRCVFLSVIVGMYDLREQYRELCEWDTDDPRTVVWIGQFGRSYLSFLARVKSSTE
jgi:small-conductance mechanosensitive channel